MKGSKELYFIVIVLVAIVILLLIPTGYENPELTRDILYDKAEVIEIDNSDISTISVAVIGTQDLKLILLSGKFEGDTVAAKNVLMGDKRIDKFFHVGDKVLAVSRVDISHSRIIDSRAEDFYRQDVELLLLIAFIFFLILVAGKTGAKAALSFLFTALAFWKLLIPAFLNGYSPLIVSIGIVFMTTIVVILLVG
ncbi:MAG: YibE/F family protein, partial [Bacteroidales bacterium]